MGCDYSLFAILEFVRVAKWNNKENQGESIGEYMYIYVKKLCKIDEYMK